MKTLVGTRKGLVIYKYAKNKWVFERCHFEGIKASYVNYDPKTKIIWAGIKHGHWGPKLHFSTNMGKTFEELPCPKFESEKETLKDFWAFASDGTGRIYLGTEPVGLFHSDDQGKTWVLNKALHQIHGKDKWFAAASEEPCLHSICVNPTDKNHILIGISVGGCLESTDRGKSWKYCYHGMKAYFLPDQDAEVGQDPHLIDRSPSNPDIVWQQNHCGVFKSQDGGKTWADFSKAKGMKASFGWAIAVDQENAETVYTVPAHSDETRVAFQRKLFVQKTTNGGKTWKVLAKGLPQKNCFDIVYRHALSLKKNHLVFGTTSGRLYTSKNKGETWVEASEHLAPIYSLKII